MDYLTPGLELLFADSAFKECKPGQTPVKALPAPPRDLHTTSLGTIIEPLHVHAKRDSVRLVSNHEKWVYSCFAVLPLPAEMIAFRSVKLVLLRTRRNGCKAEETD